MSSNIRSVSQSFLKYLHLTTWLDQQVTALISGHSSYYFDSVEAFWHCIMEEDLHPGARVRFREAFITEWIPRLPGAIWASTQQLSDFDALRKGRLFASEGMLRLTNEPFGVIRLPFGDSKQNYAVLSLTTADSWYCEFGVPLLVSDSVYNTFASKRRNRNAVEGSIEGTLSFGRMPLLNPDFLASLGTEVDRNFLESIATPIGVPYVYLRVNSPLDVSLRTYDEHPPGCIWSITRAIRNEQVIHYPITSDSPGGIKRIPVDPYTIYGLSQIAVDLREQAAIEACVKAFRSGSFYMDKESFIPKPSQPMGTVRVDVLTEFDARRPRVGAVIPLKIAPWKERSAMLEIQKTFQDLRSLSVNEEAPKFRIGGKTMISILFVAAEPTNAARLRLGEELREIQEKLQLSKLRDQFELQQRMSARPADITQALLDIHPQVVHFSGHGTTAGALCFENQVGETHSIQPEALAALFEQFASEVNCVVLNACYSEIQANAIAEHINYVVGMSQAIGDKAAIAFAVGFYQALGAGRTVEEAYKLGCVQIRLQDIPEYLTPILIKKGHT